MNNIPSSLFYIFEIQQNHQMYHEVWCFFLMYQLLNAIIFKKTELNVKAMFNYNP